MHNRGLDPVILGAGPGGLAAACYLAQHAIRPIVLEKEARVGGLCRTLTQNGFRFDIGGHRWFTKNEEVDRWVKDLMRDEFLEVGRTSRIYYNGRYIEYPLSVANVIKSIGWLKSGLAFISSLTAQLDAAPPRTMEDAYIKQFGKKLYQMFFRDYSEKVWGKSCKDLSPDWVEQRTKGLSLFGALRNALLGPSSKVESLVESFHYPKTGYQRISERMAEEVTARAGRIQLNAKVKRIWVKNNRIETVSVETGNGSEELLWPGEVISSIPITLLVKMLDPAPPREILQAASKLKFRDLITVNLQLDQQRVTDDTWIYVHDPSIPFARLHEPKNWSVHMAPPGKTSLVLEFFCTRGDAIWNKTDEELCDLAIHHLSHDLKFTEESRVIGKSAFRARGAYPVYTLDYFENLGLLKSYLAGIENLQIIGRGGTFRYNNSDHSIEMGIRAANNLLGGNHRVDAVNEAQEYLEEKVVG